MSKADTSTEPDEPTTAEQAYEDHRPGLEKLAARDDLAGTAAQVLLDIGGGGDGE